MLPATDACELVSSLQTLAGLTKDNKGRYKLSNLCQQKVSYGALGYSGLRLTIAITSGQFRLLTVND